MLGKGGNQTQEWGEERGLRTVPSLWVIPVHQPQASFNFIIYIDFGVQENKICHCFHFFPICHEVMGPDAMILVSEC